MGLMDRIATLLKANLGDLVAKAEDPEKIIMQALEDMGERLVEVKQAVAIAIATEKKLKADAEAHGKAAEQWQTKAELAVKKGDDELAKEALARRKAEADTAAGFQQQYEAQRQNVETLREQLGQLESKIAEAHTKKDLLIARSRQADATRQVQETLGKVNPSGAMATFERMERKVEAKEAMAQAVTELNTDTIEARFDKLSAGEHDLDDELAKLKASMHA